MEHERQFTTMEHAALTDATDLTLLQAAALLSGSSAWDSRPILAAGIPSFVMSDGPHGVRRQLGDVDHLGIAESEKATCFPTASALAATWNPDLAREMGEALGLEARSLGVDVLLGPGLNIKRSPLCGRNFEYLSEDPILAGRMAAGLVEGIQSTGTAACPKHFAVNSQELRRMASDSIVDERTMREFYLTGFEIVCRAARLRAIMSSYNLVNGTYAHENKHLLTDILRTEWGFDGMVVSDWGGSNSAVGAARWRQPRNARARPGGCPTDRCGRRGWTIGCVRRLRARPGSPEHRERERRAARAQALSLRGTPRAGHAHCLRGDHAPA